VSDRLGRRLLRRPARPSVRTALEDVDHLTIAIVGNRRALRRTRSIAAGSTQSLEGSAVAPRRRVCEPAPARNAKDRRRYRRGRNEASMLQPTMRPSWRITMRSAVGVNLDRPARQRWAVTEYLLLSNRTRTGLRDRCPATAWKSVRNRAGIGKRASVARLRNTSQTVCSASSGCRCGPWRRRCTLVQQPRVSNSSRVFEPQPRRERSAPRTSPNLVSRPGPSPQPRCRRAGKPGRRGNGYTSA